MVKIMVCRAYQPLANAVVYKILWENLYASVIDHS
jgi:hypothetical protein